MQMQRSPLFSSVSAVRTQHCNCPHSPNSPQSAWPGLCPEGGRWWSGKQKREESEAQGKVKFTATNKSEKANPLIAFIQQPLCSGTAVPCCLAEAQRREVNAVAAFSLNYAALLPNEVMHGPPKDSLTSLLWLTQIPVPWTGAQGIMLREAEDESKELQ